MFGYDRGAVDHRAAMSKTSGGSESSSSTEDQVLNLSRSGNGATTINQMDDRHDVGSSSDESEDLIMTGSTYLKSGNESD